MSYEHPSSSPEPPPPPADAVGDNGASRVREHDRKFVRAMHEAGLMRELDEEALGALLVRGVDDDDGPARRLDLVRVYYEADGDERAASRRRAMDRYFAHHADQEVNARGLLERLAQIAPEVGSVSLEQIGDEEGPLVLRAGEHFAAVVDPYEEALDTDEIDLRDMESEEPTISVSSLVRALNALLANNDVQDRLIELRSDGEREVYVAATFDEATSLLEAGYLEDETTGELLEFAGW